MSGEGDGSTLAYVVVDAGALIGGSGLQLYAKGESIVTVPEVIQEVRDRKARQALENLPFTIEEREPSAESFRAVCDFARKTGDLASLSTTDLKVLALTHYLEVQGNGGTLLRTEPMKAGAKVVRSSEPLASVSVKGAADADGSAGAGGVAEASVAAAATPAAGHPSAPPAEPAAAAAATAAATATATTGAPAEGAAPRASWSALLKGEDAPSSDAAEEGSGAAAAELPAAAAATPAATAGVSGGQFDDAESSSSSDGESYDGEEVAVKKGAADADDSRWTRNSWASTDPYRMAQGEPTGPAPDAADDGAFPSLGAAAEVFEREQRDSGVSLEADEAATRRAMEARVAAAKLKWEKEWGEKAAAAAAAREASAQAPAEAHARAAEGAGGRGAASASAFIGFGGGVGATGMDAADDDGDGWVGASNLREEMAEGGGRGGIPSGQVWARGAAGHAAACVTTDYAMQNVLLQMNLPLLSLQGRVVRKVKRWVLRCAACFLLVSDMDKLFCSRCGNATLERMACTMNAKTGKTHLHFARPGKRRNNLRGTKYSLPQPAQGRAQGQSRFSGDILLREDQLMTGIWRQKVNRSAGEDRKARARVLDVDAASEMMDSFNLRNNAHIQFGFGRRNPNAQKGRERRGKAKKKKR